MDRGAGQGRRGVRRRLRRRTDPADLGSRPSALDVPGAVRRPRDSRQRRRAPADRGGRAVIGDADWRQHGGSRRGRSRASGACEPTSASSTARCEPAKTTSSSCGCSMRVAAACTNRRRWSITWCPSNRLDRRYFRQWLHQNGRMSRGSSELSRGRAVPVRRAALPLAGAGGERRGRRWARRSGATNRDGLRRGFASLWFAGYVRDSWFGRAPQPPMPLAMAAGR